MNNEIKGINQTLAGFYKLAIVDPKTKEVVWEQKEWEKNLILNQGMNGIFDRSIVDCITYAAAGDGTRVNSAASGISTITQSGVNVFLYGRAGSISNFTDPLGTYAATIQVGDVLKYTNGSESMVTSVDGGYQLTVTTSYSIPVGDAQPFTVWKTSQTELEAENAGVAEPARTCVYQTGAGHCGTTTVVNVKTHRRTYDFLPQTTGQTYTELGLCWGATVSVPNSVFSRILVAGGGVYVDVGYQLRLIYDLQSTYTPASATSRSIQIGGWTLDNGTECLQDLLTSYIDTSGNSINTLAVLDPYYTNIGDYYSSIWASTVSSSHAAVGSAINRSSQSGNSTATMTKAAQVLNTFILDRSGVIPIGAANYSNIRSIGLGIYKSAEANPADATYQAIDFLFDTDHEKTSTETLSLTYRFSWGRTLS